MNSSQSDTPEMKAPFFTLVHDDDGEILVDASAAGAGTMQMVSESNKPTTKSQLLFVQGRLKYYLM